MPEAAVSGDANMGSTNVHTGPPCAEVTATKVTAAEVAPTKVTASVSATSMTASTTSKGRCRDCRTTQEDSGNGDEQCFSWHQNLRHTVSKLCRRFFRHRDLQENARRGQITAYTTRKLSASASGAINFSFRIGCSLKVTRVP
jgi:hypothetical protein